MRTDARDQTASAAGLTPAGAPSDPAGQWPGLRDIGARRSLRQYLKDLWAWRDFAITAPLVELRAQNQDNVLGQAWHLLNPVLLIAVYQLVFGVGLRAGERGGVENYLGFLIVGVITYHYTRISINAGAKTVVKNRRLVQSVNFPRAILPLSSTIQQTLAHVPAMLMMFIGVVLTGVRPSVYWLLLVPLLVLQGMFNAGMAMVTSRLTFHFRDVQEFLPYLLRIVFYVSGVLIPINPEIVPWTAVRVILLANPVYQIVKATRDAVMYDTVDPLAWAITGGTALVGFVVGFWFFRRAESDYGRV